MNKSIVSLIASASEVIFALKVEKNLVGRSHGCDFPSEILSLPVLTRATFPIDGLSREIDSHVKSKLSNGLSVYEIDADKLAELSPDIILTQDQCEVCAASLQDVEDAVCEWTGKRAQIVSLKPDSLEDVFLDIIRVAEVLEIPERGIAVTSNMRQGMEQIREKAEATGVRPATACIEWIDPLMAAGNWIPELVEIAGGRNLFGEAGQHSPWMTWEDLYVADPEVIMIFPCGFDIERTANEMHLLSGRPEWKKLSAVSNGRVYLIDGNQYCNRPGPRLVDSVEIMAEIIHPEVFNFGHINSGWIKYDK